MSEVEKKPRKRKPKPPKKKVLTAAQMNSIELEKYARALSTDELAVAFLCCEFSQEHAAKTLGWDLAAVKQVWDTPAVQRYLMKSQEIFLHKLASTRIHLLKKVQAVPAAVESRLMEIAMMEPSETKGSVDGQVKALRTLAEILGMLQSDDPLKNKTREQLKQMVAEAGSRLLEGNAPRPQ